MVQSSQIGHTISGSHCTVAVNSIAEVERKIRLYNTSLLKILTISHSVTAAHHYCEHCHRPQQPIIIYCLNYLKGWSGVFFSNRRSFSSYNRGWRNIIINSLHHQKCCSFLLCTMWILCSITKSQERSEQKKKTVQVGLQKTDSSVQVGAGLIISVGFHLFHFCNSPFFLCLL